MNKFQEALNYISSFLSQVRGRGNGKSEAFIKIGKSLITLQELIDNYSKLEKALDLACELNIKQRFDRDYLYIPNDVIKQKEKELKDKLLKISEEE